MIVFIWGMRTAIAIIVALALVPAAHAQQPHPGKRGKGKITRVAYEFATSVKLEFEFEIGTVGTRVPATCYVPARGTRVCNAFVPCRWGASAVRRAAARVDGDGVDERSALHDADLSIGDLFGPGKL